MKLHVWAPEAERVELVTGNERRAMSRGEGGHFEIERPPGGTDYRFSLDGGEPMKDPRSGWQPAGIAGASRVVDHAAFDWDDGGFCAPPLSGGIVYELHVGTFSPEGTYEGVQSRLDHLVTLGITHVELMPVNTFSGAQGWGYDGVDLYAPHPAYGSPDDLKRLVNACHERGLAVLLDVVYNHLGPEGNVLGAYGPYFTDKYHTPWGQAVNLDGAHSDEVRRYFVDNALMWMRDYHFDGLRIDAIHAFLDTGAVHLLEQMKAETRELEAHVGRPLVLIAESDLNDPRVIASVEAGGYGIDAQWSDDFHHALHAVLTGETKGYYQDFGELSHLATTLAEGFAYGGTQSGHRARRHGRSLVGTIPPGACPGHRLLGFLQNHDQVGNRAKGERTAALVSHGRLEIGAALVLTSPFVPMLFMGEEWGATTPFQYFTSHESKDLGEAVSKGRRSEFAAFGWQPDDVPDPQAPETFERSRLRWDELTGETHANLLVWHKKLIELRRQWPELTDGRLDRVMTTVDAAARTLTIRRGRVTIACNLGPEPAPVTLPPGSELLMHSGAPPPIDHDRLQLAPDTVAITATAV